MYPFLAKVRPGVVVGVLFALLLGIVLYSGISGKFRELRFNPAALLGYVVCDTRGFAERLPLFPKDYPCNFTTPVPTVNGLTVVTFVNTGWINMTKNWLYSAENNGLTGSILLITMEAGVCSHFPSIPCYHDESIRIQSSSFGEPNYQALMIRRTKLILQLMSCGSEAIMLADADIVFLANPLETLEQEIGPSDIILQRDSTGVRATDIIANYVFDYICGGFLYFKVNNVTRLLYQAVLKYQQHHLWNDQAGLNVCLRHHTLDIQWRVLSKKFATGRDFFDFHSTPEDVVLVHANFKKGSVDKAGSMISRGIWFYDEIGPDLCREFWPQCCLGKTTYPWCPEFKDQCLTKYHVKL